MYWKILGFFLFFNIISYTLAFPSFLSGNDSSSPSFSWINPGAVIPPIWTGNNSILNNAFKTAFENECFKELSQYLSQFQDEVNKTGLQTPFNVSSVECLMFCGYKKVGVVDNDGNIQLEAVRNITQSDSASYESAISKCSETEKTSHVCEKALRNIKCIFSEISWSAIGRISSNLFSAFKGSSQN